MQRGMRREEEAPKGCKGVYDWLEEKGECKMTSAVRWQRREGESNRLDRRP